MRTQPAYDADGNSTLPSPPPGMRYWAVLHGGPGFTDLRWTVGDAVAGEPTKPPPPSNDRMCIAYILMRALD